MTQEPQPPEPPRASGAPEPLEPPRALVTPALIAQLSSAADQGRHEAQAFRDRMQREWQWATPPPVGRPPGGRGATPPSRGPVVPRGPLGPDPLGDPWADR